MKKMSLTTTEENTSKMHIKLRKHYDKGVFLRVSTSTEPRLPSPQNE